MAIKPVETLIHGQATTDGLEVPLTRLVPGRGQGGAEAFRAMDPFLLLDHFGPMVLPPGTDAGFPPHPHRGFQTLTYLLQGAFRHRDSTGGSGVLRPGGAQLMTAGSGIVHEELPVPEQLATGGAIEGVQLWINLPRSQKGSRPGYQDVQPEALPWVDLPEGRLRVLAGSWAGHGGPVHTPARIAYAHLELQAGGRFRAVVPPGWMAAVVTLQGHVKIGGTEVPANTVARLGPGEDLVLEAGEDASLMLLAGEPLGEPIAQRGPFVMNTPEELDQAFLDYHAGRMGHLD